ncbi:MAG: NPCBM/NEW2 domain-containing protein [Phycisphaerales bacterium JB063]
MQTPRDDSPRTFPRLRGRRWLAALLAAATTLALTAHAPADIAQSIDQGDLSGAATVNDQGQLTITPTQGEPQTLGLADVHRIVLGDDLVIRSGDLLLLDANQPQNPTVSATIKLRAGLHHIVLPYWQGTGDRQFELHVAGPGMPGGEVPSTHFYCYRDADAQPEPSIGFDEQGFRRPELSLSALEDNDNLRRRIRYTYLVGDGSGRWEDMSAFSNMEHKRGGVAGGITYRMAGQSEHFGLMFAGFIRVDQDGEYTFSLTADDGARLYFGQQDQFSAALPPSVEAPEWSAVLSTSDTTRLTGKLDRLSEDTVTFTVPVNEGRDLALTLALSQLAELWAIDADLSRIDRSDESEIEDTAYVLDRNNPDNVLTVPGTLVGLDAEQLHFEYRGQVRHINRDRVLGLILNSADRPQAPAPGYHQTLHLKTGQVIPGTLLALDAQQITFALTGAPQDADAITLPRGDVSMIRNELGRVLDMTAIEPTAVEDIPFFSHVIPYRTNVAFDGEAIRLFDGNEYARGFAVHSRNRLYYRLDGNYTRLSAGVGLLKPDGRLGNITARVLGDGKVLWEQDNITADSGRVDVDVDLTGVQRVILEVDFGAGQNVGDRAAWVEPQLIRGSVQ